MRFASRLAALFLIVLGGFTANRAAGAEATDPPHHTLPDRALAVGNRKQLFIDDRFLASSHNISLTANPAQKLGPVMQSEKVPWELHPGFVGNVFEDGGKFKMYYGAYTPAGRALAYAESADAIHWTRPRLGLVEVAGNRDNNLVMLDGGGKCPEIATVFLDDRDVPQRRYKLFVCVWSEPYDPKRDGVWAYVSRDGRDFQEAGRVLPLTIDNPVNVQWDGRIGRYVIWTRALIPGVENQRQIARIETLDPLKPWPYNTQAPDAKGRATPEHLKVVLKADDDLDPHSDLYYNNAIKYPWAQDAYLMFITPFRHFSPGRQPFFRFKPGNDYGLVETQLAVSRDGIRWARPSRWPYFPMGLPDQWDRWMCTMGRGMIRCGNYLYQYYNSSGRTHDSGILRPEHDKLIELRNGIGAVRQRLDGFVSADADHRGGWLVTPPVVFEGRCLRLNIDTGAMGTAFVEIRDAQGRPIPGFTLAEAEEIGGNYADQRVYWKGKTDVSPLAGKPIRLYFRMTRAKLYAFQFADE